MDNPAFRKWLQAFQDKKLPLWEELPDLNLYMDQVISELNRYLTPILDTEITKTMINSYVKLGIIDRPEKKKYQRKHLAELIVVSTMKLVFALDDIKLGITESLNDQTTADAYNHFATLFNQEIAQVNTGEHPNLFNEQQSSLSLIQKVAIRSVIYKVIGTKLIVFDTQKTIL